MAKVPRMISLDSELNEKLELEDNASGLISELLRRHYDLKVLSEAMPTPEQILEQELELQKKAEELNLQVEELSKKKREAIDHDEIKKKLDKFGITNPFLIERLKKQSLYPSTMTARQMRDEYNLDSVDQVWKAWSLLHPEG